MLPVSPTKKANSHSDLCLRAICKPCLMVSTMLKTVLPDYGPTPFLNLEPGDVLGCDKPFTPRAPSRRDADGSLTGHV
jgi:hypothetical protein